MQHSTTADTGLRPGDIALMEKLKVLLILYLDEISEGNKRNLEECLDRSLPGIIHYYNNLREADGGG